MERKKQVSPEQIERARQLDLLSYLQQYEPHELVRVSGGVYSTRTNDSLKISHGKWFRWSTGVGGVSALDYLIKVWDMSFVDAVQKARTTTISLCGEKGLRYPFAHGARRQSGTAANGDPFLGQ